MAGKWVMISSFPILLPGLYADENPTTTPLIDFDQKWRLFDKGENPAPEWYLPDYEDSGWVETAGIVSYISDPGDLDEDHFPLEKIGTQLRPGNETAYLRTTFEVPEDMDPESRLILDYLVKDGAVFYLNGVEVGRTPTMPPGEIDHDTEALRAARPRPKTGFHINPGQLRKGTNVLAVSQHGYTDDENPDLRALALELSLVEGWGSRSLTVEPRHVRVMWLENPREQAMVSWTTDLKGEKHTLYLDTQSRRGKPERYARKFNPTHHGEYTLTRADVELDVPPSHYHHVHLRDLKPGTTYYLTVVSDDEPSREYHFRTAPDEDRPVKMLFAGDSRVKGSEPYLHHDRRAVNRRMAGLFEAQPEILGLIHGGDFAQMAQWRFFDPFFTDYELTTTQDGRLLPIIPARGNHDRDIGFEEAFWWPGQAGRYYYRSSLTPRVNLIVLNTEISLGGHQRKWLDQTLAQVRSESRWVVALYHRPSWPSVRGFADGINRRRFWVPLFEKYRIDLALESHDHALKRTVPILNNEMHPEGIVYIGDGGAGVPQRTPDPTRWYLREPGMVMSEHHVHLLEFNQDVLRGTAYSIGGKVLDEFERPLREDHAHAVKFTSREVTTSMR